MKSRCLKGAHPGVETSDQLDDAINAASTGPPAVFIDYRFSDRPQWCLGLGLGLELAFEDLTQALLCVEIARVSANDYPGSGVIQ